MNWELIVIQVLNAIQSGFMFFLLAAGLTLVFGIMNFINLAHGSFYMLGAYVFATWLMVLDSFYVSLLLSMPSMFLIGLLFERFLIRGLYQKTHLDQVLFTFGLALALDSAVHYVWGVEGLTITLPESLDWAFVLLGYSFPIYRIVAILVSGFIVVALFYSVHRTKFGMRLRAGAFNSSITMAMGVNVGWLYCMVFALGAMLSGLAGALVLPLAGASVGMGAEVIIIAFVIVIVGGIGSIKGAFYASMLVGGIDTLGRAFLDDILHLIMPITHAETLSPALSSILIYLLMVVMILKRPQTFLMQSSHA